MRFLGAGQLAQRHPLIAREKCQLVGWEVVTYDPPELPVRFPLPAQRGEGGEPTGPALLGRPDDRLREPGEGEFVMSTTLAPHPTSPSASVDLSPRSGER
jgi:hypothetical protein